MKNVLPGFARIMRYVVLALIIIYVALMLIYTSGSNKPFDKVEKAVEKSLDLSNLTKQDSSKFKRNFGLNAADYEGVMYYSSEFSISAEEVLLVKVHSQEQVQEVTDAIDKRIESRKNDFQGYAPEQEKLLDDSVQSVRGTYIFFASAPKANKYLNAFSKSL